MAFAALKTVIGIRGHRGLVREPPGRFSLRWSPSRFLTGPLCVAASVHSITAIVESGRNEGRNEILVVVVLLPSGSGC